MPIVVSQPNESRFKAAHGGELVCDQAVLRLGQAVGVSLVDARAKLGIGFLQAAQSPEIERRDNHQERQSEEEEQWHSYQMEQILDPPPKRRRLFGCQRQPSSRLLALDELLQSSVNLLRRKINQRGGVGFEVILDRVVQVRFLPGADYRPAVPVYIIGNGRRLMLVHPPNEIGLLAKTFAAGKERAQSRRTRGRPTARETIPRPHRCRRETRGRADKSRVPGRRL